jgi:hypothetical protein
MNGTTRRPLSSCLVSLAAVLFVGCDAGAPTPAAAASTKPVEAVTRTSETGPVKATVSLAPAHPTLGDPLSLTLEVRAQPGVEVHMPAFGEALGRFEIVDFAPRESRTEAGGTEASQRYTLAAPLSGRQTIPPLLVEFVDRRPGQDGTTKELLTDELAVEVASVLPEGKVTATLAPARGPLPEDWPPGPSEGASVLGAVALALAVSGAVLVWRRGRRARVRQSAFDVARARLAALEARGAPRGGEVDAWYVELSSIVRRYIEDRFGVRAPELTTEEFMREASASPELSAAHAALLQSFLERCDRVKFAGYRPEERESKDALAAALRFLEETRLGAPAASETAGAREGAHAVR